MTALVGGTTAFVNLDKDLVVTIDGEPQTVHSYTKTVGDVLDHLGIVVGEHDTVAPALDAPIADGTRISIRYGRLIEYTVDGEPREAWVTATSVDEALEQLGVRDENVFVSVSRSMPIGRQGLSFDLRMPHAVTLWVEGEETEIQTTAATVADALGEAGIEVGENDYVTPSLDTYPPDGAVVKVYRITGKVEAREEPIEYETERKKTNDIYVGQTKVGQKGKDGVRKVIYELVQNDDGDWEIKRKLASEVVEEPEPRIILVGTKPYPRTGAEHLNWAALAQCESSGNPRAVSSNGLYYGLYQFSLSTWRSVGGSGLPTDASPEEQTYRAQVLYMRAGAGQWPVCGSRLFS